MGENVTKNFKDPEIHIPEKMVEAFENDSKRKHSQMKDLFKIYRDSRTTFTTIASDVKQMKTGINGINTNMEKVGNLIDHKYHIFSAMLAYLISLMTGLLIITMVDGLHWSNEAKSAISLAGVIITGLFFLFIVVKPLEAKS